MAFYRLLGACEQSLQFCTLAFPNASFIQSGLDLYCTEAKSSHSQNVKHNALIIILEQTAQSFLQK